MRKVKIITDSCADLGKDIREKYDIDYAKMRTVYEGKETEASLDWEYYSPKELYDIMRNGNRVLTTQVPAEEFNRIFSEYVNEGYDIVYIACSLKLSGSVNTGAVVAKGIMEKNSDAKIFCIDSLNSCMGEGMLAVKAAELRDEGKSAQEIYDIIMPIRNTANQFCAVHSLDCLKRAGRVKASAAFFGNLFGVKPIIISDKAGNEAAYTKVKGRQNSLNEIVRMLKEVIVNPENQTIYIAHADCAEEAENVADKIKSEIPCRDVYIGYIGPIVGASVGPDTIAIFGFGKEVTFER